VRADARELAAVFAGGCIGAVARAGVAQALPVHPGAWPWATLAVNVAGAFLLAVVVALPRGHRLLGTGFCGALTTFSAFQVELLRLIDANAVAMGAGYAVASISAGLVAVAAGTRLMRRA
jgi:CrcB protein